VIHVRVRYRLTAALPDEAYAAARETLSPDDRARHDRLWFDRDRRDFAFAHALLSEMLAEAGVTGSGWSFVRGDYGKPSVVLADGRPSPVAFNLAHTRGLVACATSQPHVSGSPRAEVGVDVEPVRARDSGRDIASRFFCPGEVAALDACADDARAARFTELWTLKESYIKGLGLGLACPLHSFAFRYEANGRLSFERPEGIPADADWQFALFAPTPEFRLAVAVSARAGTARLEVSSAERRLPLTAVLSTAALRD
jgi:4'-phosphopantetheinyl transferase